MHDELFLELVFGSDEIEIVIEYHCQLHIKQCELSSLSMCLTRKFKRVQSHVTKYILSRVNTDIN